MVYGTASKSLSCYFSSAKSHDVQKTKNTWRLFQSGRDKTEIIRVFRKFSFRSLTGCQSRSGSVCIFTTCHRRDVPTCLLTVLCFSGWRVCKYYASQIRCQSPACQAAKLNFLKTLLLFSQPCRYLVVFGGNFEFWSVKIAVAQDRIQRARTYERHLENKLFRG